MQFTLSTFTTLALISGALAHMRMEYPPQWDVSPNLLAPLSPDGSDFPCQNSYNNQAAEVELSAGGQGDLKVVGGATHGGGSGQMVITYDLPPTKDSVWKVMQSWEGDHPLKADGNLSGNPDEEHPAIKYAVPKGLPSGQAVVAWNWFNRIGNREWYMKCATVTVKSDVESGKMDGFNGLPDMFRANIAGECTVPEGTAAIDFGASAGENVVVAPGATPVAIQGCSTGAGSGSGSTPSQPETPAPSSTYVEQPAGPTGAPEQEEGNQDDNSESGNSDSEELPSKPTEPVASPSPSPSPISQPDNSNKETDSGSSTGSCVEGTTVCSDGNTWSQCGSGVMQNMGLVPAGLQCQGGKLIAKRAVRFSAEHRRHRARHV